LPILELAPWHQADTPQAAQGGPPALTKEDSWGRQHGTKTAFAPMGVLACKSRSQELQEFRRCRISLAGQILASNRLLRRVDIFIPWEAD
ncbi:MAG TPA: hypothetical protein VGX93_04615, partial [Chthoniobacterales bacterium]|nr:hypothetical protein [Chthoniobacterales bacterium]